MKAYGGVDVQIHIFLTSTLVGGEWSASRPGRFFTPGRKAPCIHWIGGWVGPRAGLDDVEKRTFLTPRQVCACVQLLCNACIYRNDYVSVRAHLSEGTFRVDIQ
jgi:hypothetical protein